MSKPKKNLKKTSSLSLSKNKKILIKLKILEEARLIFESVDWAEQEINKKIAQLDHARENFLLEEEKIYEKELKGLIASLNQEIGEMDRFLEKYKKIIAAAKNGKF